MYNVHVHVHVHVHELRYIHVHAHGFGVVYNTVSNNLHFVVSLPSCVHVHVPFARVVLCRNLGDRDIAAGCWVQRSPSVGTNAKDR